jgi:hypothetical protein
MITIVFKGKKLGQKIKDMENISSNWPDSRFLPWIVHSNKSTGGNDGDTKSSPSVVSN